LSLTKRNKNEYTRSKNKYKDTECWENKTLIYIKRLIQIENSEANTNKQNKE